MRDRLIKLLKTAGYEQECINSDGEVVCSVPKRIVDIDEVGILADLLIDRGVIVPPCKVGDKRYFYKAELEEICPAKVIGIYNDFYTPSIPLWITIEYESKLVGRQVERMASEVFELLCKYTKEEAEKALAERSGE